MCIRDSSSITLPLRWGQKRNVTRQPTEKSIAPQWFERWERERLETRQDLLWFAVHPYVSACFQISLCLKIWSFGSSVFSMYRYFQVIQLKLYWEKFKPASPRTREHNLDVYKRQMIDSRNKIKIPLECRLLSLALPLQSDRHNCLTYHWLFQNEKYLSLIHI